MLPNWKRATFSHFERRENTSTNKMSSFCTTSVEAIKFRKCKPFLNGFSFKKDVKRAENTRENEKEEEGICVYFFGFSSFLLRFVLCVELRYLCSYGLELFNVKRMFRFKFIWKQVCFKLAVFFLQRVVLSLFLCW